jgi:hypothetical protein
MLQAQICSVRVASKRELARQLGVGETAVRRAEQAGRIRREADASWDLAKVRAAWSCNTDRSQQRRSRDVDQRTGRSADSAVKPVGCSARLDLPATSVGKSSEPLVDVWASESSASFLATSCGYPVVSTSCRKRSPPVGRRA